MLDFPASPTVAGPLDTVSGSLDTVQLTTKQGRQTAPPAWPAPTLRGRVLVVDDGDDNRRLVAFLLERAGAEVDTAEDGSAAIRKAISSLAGRKQRRRAGGKPFDVVLMDMQMPIMDGYEATRRLRSLGFTRPIIALTAQALSYDRQRCLDAGCSEYMSKPFDREELLKLVGKYLCQPSLTS